MIKHTLLLCTLLTCFSQGLWAQSVDGANEIEQLINNMVLVEGGTFTMGATPEQGNDAQPNEYPAHQVTLSPYYICKYEVTQELWTAVMGKLGYVNNRSGKANLPIESRDYNACVDFAEKLSAMTGKHFRLPTEAEWEFAARGGNRSKGYKYAGSNNQEDVAWYSGNTTESQPVGQKQPNELGLYDMSGNVSEWCLDNDYAYTADAQTNPRPTGDSRFAMDRGGSLYDEANALRVSARRRQYVQYTSYFHGMRLVMEAEPKQTSKLRFYVKNHDNSQLDAQQGIRFVRDGQNDRYAWQQADQPASDYATLADKADISKVKSISLYNVELLQAQGENLREALQQEKVSTAGGISATVEALQENPDVEEVSTDGYYISVKSKTDGATVVYQTREMPDPFLTEAEAIADRAESQMSRTMRRSYKWRNTYHTEGSRSKRVAIFNFFSSYNGGVKTMGTGWMDHGMWRDDREGQNKIMASLSYTLQQHGYGVDYYAHDDCTIANYNDVVSRSEQFAAIIFMTHGYMDGGARTIVASDVENYSYMDGYYDYNDEVKYKVWPVYNLNGISSSCLAYIGACSVGQMSGFTNVTWSGPNSISQAHCAVLFSRMLDNGMTLNEAYRSINMYQEGAYANLNNPRGFTMECKPDSKKYSEFTLRFVVPSSDIVAFKGKASNEAAGIYGDDASMNFVGSFTSEKHPSGHFYVKLIPMKENEDAHTISIPVNKDGSFNKSFNIKKMVDGDVGIYRIEAWNDRSFIVGDNRIRQQQPRSLIYTPGLYINGVEEMTTPEGNLIPVNDAYGLAVSRLRMKPGQATTLYLPDEDITCDLYIGNRSVATAQLKENAITITAKANGQTTLTIADLKSGYSSELPINVSSNGDNVYPTESYSLSEDGKTLLRWYGDETDIDLTADPAFDTVEEINEMAFSNCRSLKHVILPQMTKTIGRWAFQYCNDLESVQLPSTVKEIKRSAFYQCYSLTDINVPEGVTTIGDWAFEKCTSLKDITLPYSIESLGKSVFMDCSSLEKAIIHAADSLRDYLFQSCTSLREVQLPLRVKGVAGKNIEYGIFYDCPSIEKISIPEGAGDDFDDFEFFRNHTRIHTVNLPSTMTTLDGTFFNCPHIEFVNFAQTPEEMKGGTFYGTSLHYFMPDAGLKVLGEDAFAYCKKITRIILPEGVTTIGISAFRDCPALRIVDLPSTVKNVGDLSFDQDSKLETVICRATTPPTIDGIDIMVGDLISDETADKAVLYVPSASVEAYRKASGWNKFKTIQPL